MASSAFEHTRQTAPLLCWLLASSAHRTSAPVTRHGTRYPQIIHAMDHSLTRVDDILGDVPHLFKPLTPLWQIWPCARHCVRWSQSEQQASAAYRIEFGYMLHKRNDQRVMLVVPFMALESHIVEPITQLEPLTCCVRNPRSCVRSMLFRIF